MGQMRAGTTNGDHRKRSNSYRPEALMLTVRPLIRSNAMLIGCIWCGRTFWILCRRGMARFCGHSSFDMQGRLVLGFRDAKEIRKQRA